MRFALAASLQENTATLTTLLLPNLHEAAYQRYMTHPNVYRLVTLAKDCPHIISPTTWNGELPFSYKNSNDVLIAVVGNKLGIEVLHKAESLKEGLTSIGICDCQIIATRPTLGSTNNHPWTGFKPPTRYDQAPEERTRETLSHERNRNT